MRNLSRTLCLFCALLFLICPINSAAASSTSKRIATLEKTVKKQKEDIQLLELRLDQLEQMVRNLKEKEEKETSSGIGPYEITYP